MAISIEESRTRSRLQHCCHHVHRTKISTKNLWKTETLQLSRGSRLLL